MAFELVAVEASVSIHMVTAASSVYLFEVLIQFFCLFYLFHPSWLPIHQTLHPRHRYHRTHISHLRLDRAVKYGLAQKAITFNESFVNAAPSVLDPISSDSDSIPDLTEGSDEGAWSTAELDDDGYSGCSDSDSILGLVELSDNECDAWSTTDSITELQPLSEPEDDDTYPHPNTMGALFPPLFPPVDTRVYLFSTMAIAYSSQIHPIPVAANSFIAKRARWQSAKEWLNRLHLVEDDVAHTSLVDRCWHMLGHLPWDGIVPGLSPAVHLTMQDLASFLGTDWLNDDMINAGVDHILQRLDPWSPIRILNCLFIQSLTNAHAATGGGTYRPPKFSPIEKAILAGKVDIIYFPLHVSGNHWTLLKINLLSKTIAYADSLGGSPPSDELALIRCWIFPVRGKRMATPAWFLNLSETAYDPVPETALDWDATDSEFDIPSIGPTTPESSDFEVEAIPPLNHPHPPVQQVDNLLLPPPAARLELEDVDLFLDFPAPDELHPVGSSSVPPDPDPTSMMDGWVSLPEPSADYYTLSDGEDSDSDSDSHESLARCRHHRRRNENGPKAGSSWAHQKQLKSDAKASMTRLGTFRDKVLEDDLLAEFDDSDVAINRPMPEEGSMKFVPVAYRDKELGTLYLWYHGVRDLIELEDGRSPWLKFAQGCVDGTYSSDTLTRMVKVMVLKSTCIKKGKSMRNLKYPAEFDQFCNLLASTSPRAYLTFQKTFGGPGLRAMCAKRAKLPRFQPDLSAFNVATAADIIKKLKYEGPVSLLWDDTALEACISVYQESKENDDLDALFEAATLKKADKLRVWLLSIPLPKIPPILVAAVARGSSTKAEDLAAMHHKLAALLHDVNIHPISLASDGAEVERAAQRMIAESTPNHYVYVIPHPNPGCRLILKIPLYYVDKQDDHAAARMFSGNTLEFQLKNYPGQTGLSVYLFVLGELVDAWQNRNISHRDRAKMVLRARFFLMAWQSHVVAHPGYNVKTQFISRESYDIFFTICDGLLSLIVAYRKYFPTYPLLPWLHSTEVCEHLFGMLRQLKKDFNYTDVLYLEHKLRILMMGAFANLSPDQQANQMSAGYVHTYFKADDLDTTILLQYPTDEDLVNASKYGFDEASQLLAVIGIDAEAMLWVYQAPEPVQRHPGPLSTKSRPPQTIIELLALYQSVPLKSSKDEETFEACEMALATEALDKSLAIAALPESTEESLDDICLEIEAWLAMPLPFDGRPRPSPADYALPLALGNDLNDLILVTECMCHQTKSTANAVRQHGRLSLIMENRTAGVKDSGPSLRESLLKRLAAAVPTWDTLNKTTGVDRYVRHAGTFRGSGVPATVRIQNKATVKNAVSAKFVAARAKAFAGVQWIHENMYLANIMELNPLKPDDFVIVLKPSGATSEVVLGTVITMYTKSTMHDWIPNVSSVGLPSYIYISVYRQFAGAMFTSIACEKLSCPTVLQIPRTHILFSLASFKITRQDITTKLCQGQTALHAAVRELGLLMKENRSDAAAEEVVEEEQEEES
ncbi:hypothetical protein B0H10DRAFT_2226075 [Mycena sp. CBHHK59/15]|nr:hypothetical protein B0H10DRAFT_2226075 [Mycena sp. CBHHK59/15]